MSYRNRRQELWEGSEPRPQGKTPLERPRLEWQMRPKGGASVRRVQLTVNERPIPTRYDTAQTLVIGEPTEPVPLGLCKVACEVWFSNDRGVELEWEFTRVAPPPPAPAPDALQQSLVETLNRFRRQLPLPDTVIDAPLCLAALRHSQYLQRNRLALSHQEVPGRPGFFGETPQDRAEHAGSFEPCYEVLVKGAASGAIQALLDAPYHRTALLQPGGFRVGAGPSTGYTSLLCQEHPAQGIVVYPADGQRNIPCLWDNTEEPDPLRLWPDADSTVGYPITLHHFGPEGKLQLVDASLTTVAGKPVPHFQNSPANDDELDNTLLLIPHKPLTPETTYQVRLTARTAQGTQIARAWQFTTEKKRPSKTV